MRPGPPDLEEILGDAGTGPKPSFALFGAGSAAGFAPLVSSASESHERDLRRWIQAPRRPALSGPVGDEPVGWPDLSCPKSVARLREPGRRPGPASPRMSPGLLHHQFAEAHLDCSWHSCATSMVRRRTRRIRRPRSPGGSNGCQGPARERVPERATLSCKRWKSSRAAQWCLARRARHPRRLGGKNRARVREARCRGAERSYPLPSPPRTTR